RECKGASGGRRREREGAEEGPSRRGHSRSRQQSGRRDQRDAVLAAAYGDAFRAVEEVEPFIDNRSPDRETEIVADQMAFRDAESVSIEAVGAEGVGAVELEDVASPNAAP